MADLVKAMFVDPGGSTGLVTGRWNLGAGSLKECVATSTWESETITGDELFQADHLLDHFQRLLRWPMSIRDCDYALVIEDYIQQPVNHVLQREALAPVRVTWAFLGAVYQKFGTPASVIFQPPGMRVPETRLKLHDAWIRGRVHERAAMGHALAWLDKRLK